MARRRSNPVARSPLLRKGGVHQQARSGRRFKDKQALRRETRAYWNRKNGGDEPLFFRLPIVLARCAHPMRYVGFGHSRFGSGAGLGDNGASPNTKFPGVA